MLGTVFDSRVDGSHWQQHGSKRLENTTFESSNTDDSIVLRKKGQEKELS